MAEDKLFRGASTGSILSNPQMGFMFPCFDDRTTNIYGALYYSRSSSVIHEELIQALFNTAQPQIAPEKQKNAFGGALSEALEEECSLEVVQAVTNSLRQRIEEHKESRDPEPLPLSVREVGDVAVCFAPEAEEDEIRIVRT